MLDCKHASHLLSRSLERPLSLQLRLALRLHLLLCDACTQFSRQLVLLRAAVGSLSRRIENDHSLVLPDQARERIAGALAVRAQPAGDSGRQPQGGGD